MNIQGENIMNPRLARHFCLFVTLVLIGAGFSLTRASAGQGIVYAEEGVEALAYGPVHEAFAEPIEFDPKEGMLVQKPPPEPIEELPPDQIPEGENVKWIPGYWAWDDEMNDYIWVSGVWRAAPPGREWVPGYWFNTGQGFQWVSGHWGKAEVDEIEYLPQPPATVESGPNAYAPSPDHSWVPGCWIWSRGRYVWQPGYWERMRPEWIWIPAHYEWTPRGYVFVGGYWDYVVSKRGILFAPVYFGFSRHMRHGFRYSPSMMINLDIFFDSLFLRLRYNHYYFGDYYDPGYYQRGFYPWFSPYERRRGYDPIFAHQRWRHRNDRNWERRIQNNYRNRRDHRDARPSRRLPSMAEMRTKGWKTKDGRQIAAKPLDYVSKSGDTSWRFKSLGTEERKRIDQRQKDFRKYRQKRHDWETKKVDRPQKKPSAAFKPTETKTPRSPVKSKSRDQYEVKKAPPKRYKASNPDHDVKPLKRRQDYDKRDLREKGTKRVWKPDGQHKKTDDRGRGTDVRALKTKHRGQNTNGRGVQGGDKGWQSGDRVKKPEDKGKKAQDRGQVMRDKVQKPQDRGKVPQAKKQKPQNSEQKTHVRDGYKKSGGEKNHGKGRIKDEDKQNNQEGGKKKGGRR
jgi:hypothetical protein